MIKILNNLFDYLIQNNKRLFLFLIIFRCIDALLINTFFDPDEYWQSLEVAHKIVFGYGYLTWEWSEGIRSFVHPLFFIIPFKILSILNLDSTKLIIIVPKLLSGILAAIGDLYLFKLTLSLFNNSKQIAKWTLICQLFSWYTFVCIVRTYSNSIETLLFIISLYYFPLPSKSKENDNPKISVALTIFAFMIRPTTAIMWLYLIPLQLYQLKSIKRIFNFIIFDCLFITILSLLVIFGIDYMFYGKFIVVPYNFLYFNVLKNVSSFYGTHPIHWYFSQGFPTIAFTMLPLFFLSIGALLKTSPVKLHLAYLTLCTIGFFSLLAHKEFRFIFPILPLVMMYSGYYISNLINFNTTQNKKDEDINVNKKKSESNSNQKSKINILISILLIANIPMIIFFSNFHQRSPIDIMYYINDNIVPKIGTNGYGDSISVDLLMSCHATPYQSYIHNPNLKLSLLECPPPLYDDSPLDEKSLFYKDPLNFMKTQYNINNNNNNNNSNQNLKPLPDYFIVEDELLEKLEAFLISNSYTKEYHLKKPLDITSSTVFIKNKK